MVMTDELSLSLEFGMFGWNIIYDNNMLVSDFYNIYKVNNLGFKFSHNLDPI